MFNVGELRSTLEVFSTKNISNNLGMALEEKVIFAKLRCKAKYTSAKEGVVAGREYEVPEISFLVQTRKDIPLDYKILHKGKEYNIKKIIPYGYSGFIEIYCIGEK